MRIPWTLWRMVFGELLKLVCLSTAILACVMAFGAVIKPLSDGKLDATDAVKFIFLATVPMLAYALPFAAGFASTLVYYRLAQDNEALAAYAGGVSHRRLLLPGLLSGLLLACGLAVLNEQVIPRFLRTMERMITLDVTRFMSQQIEQGKAVTFDRTMLLADQVRRVEPDPSSGASDVLLLTNMSAIEVGSEGAPTTEVTATRAKLWLFPDAGEPQPGDTTPRALIWLRLENVLGYQQGKGWAGFRDYIERAWSVPSGLKDKPKFRTFGELRAMSANPEQMNWVDARRRNLAMVLAERAGLEIFQKQVRETNTLDLLDERGRPVQVRCGGMVWVENRWRLLPVTAGEPIRIRLLRVTQNADGSEGAAPTIVLSEDAYLLSPQSGSGASRLLEFRLELLRARTQDISQGSNAPPSAERAVVTLSSLTFPTNPAKDLLSRSAADLLVTAAPFATGDTPDNPIAHQVRLLEKDIAQFRRSLMAERHQRMAMSVSVLLIVATGAITALRMAKRLPLSVYMWTFFPALGCFVTMSGGQQLTTKIGTPGLFLMWAGVAGLAAYAAFMYRTVAKH